MYSSAIVYRTIASELQNKLPGLTLSACFSNTRDELVFHFEGENKLQLTVRFAGGEMFFFCEPIAVFPGRYALNQFRTVENLQLLKVEELPGERAFRMVFQNGNRLYFKGYGKFGNVLLYSDEPLPEMIFRKELKADLEKPESSFEVVQEIPEFPISDEKQIKSCYPWFTGEIMNHLIQLDFYQLPSGKQEDFLQSLPSKLQGSRFGIQINTDPPVLKLIPDAEGEILEPGFSGLEIFARTYLRRFYFLEEKAKRLQQARQRQKHLQKLLTEQKRRVTEIETRRSYKELGDIILTYAHSIKPGVTNAFLTDYFTGNQIRIKLDSTLSAAGNAEKYYRKAKNEILEKSRLMEDISRTNTELLKTNETLLVLENASDFKDLKGKVAEVKAKPTQAENKPYKLFEMDGYEIWVGKNAKSNDAMLKLAGKNDMWLHARGYAGSHVIVRKKGTDFPDNVIAYAAKLAAENSKAKTQKLVPVYCVERKFVSKPKKALPGEVVVLKESVVDADLG